MKINIQLLLCFIFLINYGFSQNLHVDDFDNDTIASFPIDWDTRGDQATKEYLIAEDTTGNNYLCAKSLNSDMFILKKLKVDLVEYPYLNWSWRANDLPTDGDESEKEYCDAAACIAVVLKLSKWRPRSIKYTWSTTLDSGVVTKSPYAFWPSRSDIIVVKSGNDELSNWQEEKRHVLNDYLSLYGKERVKSLTIEAIVIMTDSDNTKSLSTADYDSIYFSKN